jgi:hypothetical protein
VRDAAPENGDRRQSRKLRLDELPANVIWSYARGAQPKGASATSARDELGHSGRRFVLVSVLVLLSIWGLLYLLFRDWRARYRQRALYGASIVVPAIDPLARIEPPDVAPESWRDAVASTRSMLLTVISSNLLDEKQMRELRTELAGAAARSAADPKRAVTELATIWNNIADRGEFLLRDSRSASGTRHARPKILPPRPAKPAARPSQDARGSPPHRSESAWARAMNSSTSSASARSWPLSPRSSSQASTSALLHWSRQMSASTCLMYLRR